MANATVSQLGQVNASGDANALFLKVFSGEVLATFMRENKMLGMTSVRSITSGKSATFPVIGTTSASYHTVGNEITGTQVKHNEKIINIDDLLLSSAFLSNLEEAKNHYDVRSVYSSEMGRALANKVDQNLIQLAVLASQASSTITGGNGGEEITDADANTNAASLITSIFDAAEKLDNKALTAFSVKMNMTLQSSTKNYISCNYPHQDQPEHRDTWIFLYYVNDSDGDTIIFDGEPPNVEIRQRITPKANSGVFFSNKYWHASSNPISPNRRVNINFNLMEL